MATVFYDKAAVEVEFLGEREVLLASDCSLSYSSPQTPLYAVGNKGPLGQFPAGARQGEVSFGFLTSLTGSYLGASGNIINSIASGIKLNMNSEVSGVTIKFAGVTGIGYMNSYSLGIQSNSVSSSNVGFTFFGNGTQLPVSGFLTSTGGAPIQTGKLATGIAHGRYTDLSNFATTLASAPSDKANVFSADYSISFNHNPIYTVGQEFPAKALYTNAQESLGLTEDVFQTGLKYNETAQNYRLQLKGLSSSTTTPAPAPPVGMEVFISGAKVVSTAMSAGMDDIVRTQTNLTSAY